MLSRHQVVLEALDQASQRLVITPRYGDDDPMPDGWYWQTIEVPDFDDLFLGPHPFDLYVRSMDIASSAFNNVLVDAADDRIRGVIVAPDDLRYLYHPYCGGADVVVSTTAERDELKAKFSGWLSARADGL
jgi:hypothetical protein